MKNFIKTAFFLGFLIILAGFVFAENGETFPQPKDKYVNDFAEFLNESQVTELKTILAELEKNTTAEVVLVIIPTVSPSTPQEYRTKLFNNWGIGKKEADNGLLILYAVQEKRIEVETGYGLEGILPDSKLGRILDETYVPMRDQNRTAEGIVLFTKSVAEEITKGNTEEIKEKPQDNLKPNEDFVFIVFILLMFGFGGFIIYYLIKYKDQKGKHGGRGWGFAGGGFGGLGGGGGFGGGGFGGGSSGGGGVGR